MTQNGLLKMKELAEASGVSAGTIKHYLREGLLPEPVRTSRNMAYYPPEFVERIRLIKQLQEERFMPLKVIKEVLEDDPERTKALVELEVVSPNSRGYGARDVEIVEAISRFRAGGYEERIGFTVYDTLRYKRAMASLVKEEVDVLMERLAGEMDPDEAMELIEAGTQPLNDLIAAMHTKALVAELERRRGSAEDGEGKSGDHD